MEGKVGVQEESREHKEGLTPPLFRNVLVSATFGRNRAIGNNVTTIDLGVFRDEINAVWKATEEDPEKREHGKVVYVTKDKKVFVQTSNVEGEKEHIVHKIEATLVREGFGPFKKQQFDRRFGTGIHSHPYPLNMPPSPQDLYSLFIKNTYRSAGTAVVVVGPQITTVVFRGRKTPQLTEVEIKEKVTLWNKLLSERRAQFGKPFDEIYNYDIVVRAQRAFLRDIANRYDLRIYQGENSKIFVTRRAPENLQ